ncbi:DUF3899 domain-containing protein [Mycoplasma bradburyae]|uniref:DUF3899 domain-containing protein n=1 Tax=Mycoplasma bradburyae TaxID=2963128 RepID=A0AAW6HNX7_9MOLU|nr:DUF3899 domain-containing protein [Mycoplasma bradburyae]MDC4163432.1 hypothetical protein [Mycoplasma bradburyae]MDC4181689.1 hypothetical protein [Mycoplasma bradburyae]MDC4182806.1 hypothetical protein [Mycoplasma bradburyae]MDC4183480.1 hypothetical protein [Mycoplasma bradburyae]MDC4183864.1 hypothetical protein [Mycoplasma bradburyae]
MGKSKPLKTGYSNYSNSYINKLNKNDLTDQKINNTINQNNLKYSKGWFGFCFCLIVVIVVLFVLLFVNRGFGVSKKTQILDAVTISSGIGFLFHAIGFINRQNIFMMLKFKFKKLGIFLSLKKQREKKDFLYDHDNASNYIKTYEDYLTYAKEKNKASFKVFYITFLIYGILFLISIILSFSLS